MKKYIEVEELFEYLDTLGFDNELNAATEDYIYNHSFECDELNTSLYKIEILDYLRGRLKSLNRSLEIINHNKRFSWLFIGAKETIEDIIEDVAAGELKGWY